MNANPDRVTYFGATDARGKRVPFGIKQKDRNKHMYVIGKTGMGKSTLLENMAIQDIRNGEGIAFIDPHGGTADKLLDYIPAERMKDVVYFAPFDMNNPIAFNVMEDVGYDKRHLVVSGLMATFKKIWVDAWSARMEYILTNTLLALLEYPGATLLGVNRMYTDKAYRKAVVENVKDPIVKDFWVKEFATYTDRYTQEATPAIQNKIGQFTGNPLIRNIIGQPTSSFDIRKMMDERKILIMNLSKGQVGETNMRLLGSMLTTRIYLAAMSRADLSADEIKRLPNSFFYVDEFQNFANETFAEILSEARKYNLNLIIAHQYVEQMEEEVRAAVFGNVGTTVTFRVGPFDAEVLETIFMPEFTKEDLANLGLRQIYLTLMIDGVGSRPFSATTIPPIEPPPHSYRAEVIASSRAQFSSPRAKIEQAIFDELRLASEFTEPEEPKPRRTTKTFRPPAREYDDRPPRPRTNVPRQEALPPADGEMMLPKGVPTPSVRSAPQRPSGPPHGNAARPFARQPEPSGRPAPAASQKSAEDLRAILKRMTEGAAKDKGQKVSTQQAAVREAVSQARPAPVPQKPPEKPPQAPPKPQNAPQAAPSPAPAQQAVPQGQKPFEVPEQNLRDIFERGI
jgi:hypothetical protein